jgi:hypothetical protein
MAVDLMRDTLERALADGQGILRLEPSWVARDWLPPGRRLGLSEEQYDVGERGFICERWLGSVTKADNRVGPPDEGLSYLAVEGRTRLTLKQAVEADRQALLGAEYAATHEGLGRLAKIYDYGARIAYHIHPRQEHAALVGRNPKEESYYFPSGVEMGAHPESFLGVHPWIAEQKQYDVLLPYLIDWDSDLILKHAPGYLNVAEEGFHIPAGVLHAPGTALTIELQEDSDVLAILQALNAGRIVSKELLFKDVRPEDRERYGERFVLEFVDWEVNGDPYFYENRHLTPQLIEGSRQPGGEEYWIYYNTTKFSGKKLVIRPGETYTTAEKGVYNILVWRGEGSYGGRHVSAGDPAMDELLISHEAAVRPVSVENSSRDEMIVIKFFGPDINPDVPMIPRYGGRG